MDNKIALISLLVVSTLCVSIPSHAWGYGKGPRADLWIGPHFNLHFGDDGVEFSLGLETSVWTEHPFETHLVPIFFSERTLE